MTFFIVLGAIGGGSYVKERGEGVEKRRRWLALSLYILFYSLHVLLPLQFRGKQARG